jgi:hypothetical protein
MDAHRVGPEGASCIGGGVPANGSAMGASRGYGDAHAPDVLGRSRAVGGGLVSRAAPSIKKPPPGQATPEGVCQHTRRLALYPHGALTSEAAYPLQSSPLQGLLLHEYSCPTPWIFAPTRCNIVHPLPHLSRG